MRNNKLPQKRAVLRKRLALCVGLTIAPFAVSAQSVTDQVVEQLRAQGYTEIVVTHTWLGRLRFVSERGDFVRELVINPQTGEILRDYLRSSDEGADGDNDRRIIVPGSGASGGGGGGTSGGHGGGNDDEGNDYEDDDDEDDDDEDDDDDDDDEDDEDDDDDDEDDDEDEDDDDEDDDDD